MSSAPSRSGKGRKRAAETGAPAEAEEVHEDEEPRADVVFADEDEGDEA